MASWIILIILLLIFTLAGTWLFATLFGRGEALPPIEEEDKLDERNLAAAEAGSISEVSFELVPRGYRPEQVDLVLEKLGAELEAARSGRKSE